MIDAIVEVSMNAKMATSDIVELNELLEFVRDRHKVVLVTKKRDGSPQVSPVTAGLDSNGRIVIATYPERAKARNARRDARVSLLVLSDDWNGAWVQIDGQAEVLDLPEALDPLVEYFRVITSEYEDWDEYRAAMQRQGKSLIRVTIDRWGALATGGLRPRKA